MLPCVQIESLNEKNLVRTAAVYGPSGAPGPSLMHSFIICLFGGENYVARQTMHIFSQCFAKTVALTGSNLLREAGHYFFASIGQQYSTLA